MKAWFFQDNKHVKKVGKKKASHYVGWIDPQGKKRCKSFGPGSKGKTGAMRYKDQITAELMTGTYKTQTSKSWETFMNVYEEKIVSRKNILIGLRCKEACHRKTCRQPLMSFEPLPIALKAGILAMVRASQSADSVTSD